MPELTREILFWVEVASPGALAISLLWPVSFAFRRRRWGLVAFVLLMVLLGAEEFRSPIVAGIAGLALDAGAIVFLVSGWLQSKRLHAAWLKRAGDEAPVMLQAPFEGRWKASGTGPWASRNHHLAASDQWFGADWVRVDGESRGSRILAPVDGVVGHVENGHPDKRASRWVQRDLEHPAGNYVSIRVDGRENVFVILAHLERDSIEVLPGQSVKAGDVVGRCGNSGNTTRPHLHVHAQPTAEVAPGSVWGVPVLYGGRTEWMRGGEMLDGAKAGEGLGT
jgi:murein DD-endopeptidase MepM/ murein hydrolase activator NlpD